MIDKHSEYNPGLDHMKRRIAGTSAKDEKIAAFKYRGHIWLACIAGCAFFWVCVWHAVS